MSCRSLIRLGFLLVGPLALANTFTVTTTSDASLGKPGNCPGSSCSLRDAIAAANADSQTDSITFGIPSADPGCTAAKGCVIVLTSALSTASTAGITIDGASQAVSITGQNPRAIFNSAGHSLTLRNLAIRNSQSTDPDNGGAVWNQGTLAIDNVIFDANSSVNDAGAINNDAGTLTISNSTFTSNVASTGTGGAILNQNPTATATVTNSSFSQNRCGFFGASIANFGGATITLTQDTFSSNAASAQGGGMMNGQNSTANVNQSSFDSNTSVGPGGGISNQGTLTLNASTLSSNQVNATTNFTFGGGLDNSGTATVTNSTFANNSVAGDAFGGGIANYGTLTVINSTIVSNTAPSSAGGGIYTNQGATTTVKNSIISGSNTAGGDCVGTILDGGGNIADDATCVFTASNSTGASTTLGASLTAVTNFGGPTQTVALLSGSPAIGLANANCPTTDQRGVPRESATKCSSGAFEFLSGITILPANPTISASDTQAFTADATYADSTSTQNGALTNLVKWTAPCSSVAAFGTTAGLANAVGAGKTQVIASLGGFTTAATCSDAGTLAQGTIASSTTLTVNAAPVPPTTGSGCNASGTSSLLDMLPITMLALSILLATRARRARRN